jgi:Holliday junction resolvasome, DNA-binding subunit
VEMRDRLEKLEVAAAQAGAPVTARATGGADADAVDALVALGYKPAEASRMVRAVFEPGMETEALIKAALQGGSR